MFVTTSLRYATLAVAAAATLALPAGASAKETISYAYLADPALDGILYAIRTGKVKSDKIDIKASALAIPALIQSTPAKRYDVIMNAVMAIPFAKRRGLDLVVLSSALRGVGDLGAGIWVKKDSPAKTIADLKGKKIGNYALTSTGTTWIRIALRSKYKINVSYKGGDMNWVQIPAPALLSALESGRVDAATLIHAQAFKARQTGNYRLLAQTNKDIRDTFKVDTVSAVNVTYPEKLKAKPEAFREFNRVLRESVKYAVAHADEVGQDLAKTKKVDPKYFAAWIKDYSFFPGYISAEDRKAMQVLFEQSKEMGILKTVPDVGKVIWKDAITK
ncbi:MAG: ABC transporter substrate-binding protein [Hyphomicrobiales bacterium]|nr:ABC transporter substrate-binding protein [Hyphomicrobiales bacterium]